MPNNNLQDIVSGSGRSIRRIPISRKPKARRLIEKSSGYGKVGGSSLPPQRKRTSRAGLWFVAIIAIIVLFIVLSSLFSGVKVKVTPNQEEILIDGTFSAFRSPGINEIGYEIMTLTRKLSGEVEATGEEFVEEKASGRIVVYNNYSTATQRLIKNTRFETSDGLIYRIKNAVTVPGRQTKAGEIVPGSLEVKVYADKTGVSYNIGLSDFTIPGLKGDPRYSKFYARSKTPMEGGASGLVKRASPEDLAKTTEELDFKLKVELLEEANSVKPEGFLLLSGSYIIASELTTSNSGEDKVLITAEATFYGFIFDENEFAQFVAENTIATYDGGNVELVEYDNLKINILNSDPLDLTTALEIVFSLSGDAKVVWVFDEDALLADLVGQPKKRVENILSGYPSIEKVEVVLRPFWKRSLPDKESKIKIERIIR